MASRSIPFIGSGDSVDILFGTALPGGDSGEQDASPIGSIYMRTAGSIYKKITDTNALADWVVVDIAASGGTSNAYNPSGW